MTHANILTALRVAGLKSATEGISDQEQAEIAELQRLASQDPMQLVMQLMLAKRRAAKAEDQCSQAAEAADKLHELLKEMVNGHKQYCRLETIRDTPDGPRAVCNFNGTIRELSIHPDVDLQRLRSVKSWDYVAVHELVVVGIWDDDPYLYASAHGDVVEMRGYKDQARHLVHVVEHGSERIVYLAEPLWNAELPPRTRLVLQRDDRYRAISTAPAEIAQSRFEVSLDKINMRLEDLAGIEEIAETLIEDILLRVYYQDICQQFCLEPLKGILLYSKPGMGKTAFMRAIARWLHEHSDAFGFDVLLYVVKPNETKSMWHGEDARIVREELWGAIRARQMLPRTRPLVQLVVLDEFDSLGKRAGGRDQVFSSAQSESLEAMLVEMDGMMQATTSEGPPVHVLCAGMTNRPDRIDEAAKRPGRFDLVLPMPDVDEQGAEGVMAIYARGQSIPWYLDGEIYQQLDEQQIRHSFLRPALAHVFSTVVLKYKTDTQRSIDVKAGQILANVHYKDAVNRAKKRAAARFLRKIGTPAVAYHDVVDCLLDVALDQARQMAADPQMLIRQLEIKIPVAGVDVVPKSELEQHRYVSC